MKIYLVRHGETECNKKNVYYGQLDSMLTQKGWQQASQVGVILKDIVFDQVYTSPLSRAKDTAKMIGKQANMPFDESMLLVKKDLGEIDFGCFEGLSYKEIKEKWADAYEAWAVDWKNTPPPNGESTSQFFDRCEACFLEIIKEAKEKKAENILIVAHNGVLRSIFASVLGIKEEGAWFFDFEQGAYSMIEFSWSNYIVRKINARE